MVSSSESVLSKAILTVLRPLLRVLIRNEISHAQFSELARQAYVDVAYDHFSIPNRKMTYSRAAVLTGLSRKEIVRLNALRNSDVELKQSTPNRALRVINGWMRDTEFHTKDGKPDELPVQGKVGSFSALVARYSGDITLGAVLDELVRVGIVSRLEGNRVRLDSQGYIPRKTASCRSGSGLSSDSGNIRMTCFSSIPGNVSVSNAFISNSASWGILADDDGCTVNLGANVTFGNNLQGDILQ